ncbi:MAG: DUF58 domain-containing protein [Elusimicrobia bacterium]|nr:DUF58 domain-containing protein [Elusimicrobiota bacterium]
MRRLQYLALWVHSALRRRFVRRLTPAGWLALIGLVVSAALGMDTHATTAYRAFTLLAALLVLAWIPAWFMTLRIAARRRLPRYGTAGLPVAYTVAVRNLSSAPLRGLSVLDETGDPRPSWRAFAAAASAGGPLYRLFGNGAWKRLVERGRAALSQETEVPELSPGGEAEVRCELTPLRRGRLELSSLSGFRSEPLGLARSIGTLAAADAMLILPKRYPIPRLDLPGGRRMHPGGLALSAPVGESQEFLSLREYRPGDPLRRVHWRSLPKTGKLIVKEFQEERFTRHALILDACAPEGEVFEEAVSAAASLAFCARTQDSLLDLLFVGERAYCFTSGRGQGTTERLLEVLAGVAPSARPFSDLRAAVMPKARLLSGAIVLLQAWDEERRAFLRELRGLGVPVVAGLVRTGGPPPSPDPAREATRTLEVGRMQEALAAFVGGGAA